MAWPNQSSRDNRSATHHVLVPPAARFTRASDQQTQRSRPARRRIGFIVLLSQTTRAREDSNL